MNDLPEPPQRSGGIDFDRSDVQAQDVIGRDKIELNLPPLMRKGCYVQLSENIRLALFLGVLLILIYSVFRQLDQANVSQQTPTPTAVETATPTATPEPVTTPTAEGQLPVLPTVTQGPAQRPTNTVARSGGVTPTGPSGVVPPTHAPPEVTPTGAQVLTPVVRPPTPTPRATPTPLPTASPRPRPSPTPSPRPATPTPACPSAAARLGPVAKLATVGDRFTVSVRVSCAVNVAGYQVELRFDPAVVVVRKVEDAGFLSNQGGSVFVTRPDVDNNAGKATLGAVVVRPGPYAGGSGTLATFELEAVGVGSTDLDLNVSLSNTNAEAIPVSVTDGGVVVQPRATATPASP